VKTDVEYLRYMWPMRTYLITSVGRKGKPNIIAVSFCMPVSKTPPLLAFAIGGMTCSSKLIEHDKMWEFYPQGIKEAAMRYHERYSKPIIVTENGCCTDDDAQRVRSIGEHLRHLHGAIKEGAASGDISTGQHSTTSNSD
jgi:hypothetical protein